MQPGEWTKVKIEVDGRRAKLYINDSPNPSLVVDGLKGEDLEGGIGLYSFIGEEAYFSNLKITPPRRSQSKMEAKPQEHGTSPSTPTLVQ